VAQVTHGTMRVPAAVRCRSTPSGIRTSTPPEPGGCSSPRQARAGGCSQMTVFRPESRGTKVSVGTAPSLSATR
jgi:hypothetical protein